MRTAPTALAAAILCCLFTHRVAVAQTACPGTPIAGTVEDSSHAVIPGATVRLDDSTTVIADTAGRFRIACASNGAHQLFVTADTFSTAQLAITLPLKQPALTVTLHPAEVNSTVEINGDDPSSEPPAATASGPSQTISGKRLDTLADDPDDLLRELQQLAAAAGGSPSGATIAVDGFDKGENGAHLPPKSSIAYIKVNPDLFSAEYRQPPFGGGRIEIYTKPGQPQFHGALFTTQSASWMNALDPFTTNAAPIGKQRYGFELSGPIRKVGSDFFASLEHRLVNNVAAVNAFNVFADGTVTPFTATYAAPQTQWNGNVKTDWQLGQKNTFIISYDHFSNDVTNNGVGGTSLQNAGFSRHQYDDEIHITNVTTISPKLMHEGRVGIQFDGFSNTPNSTAPQVSVAGAFTSGNASLGANYDHELIFNVLDDAILQTKHHLLKVGTQFEFVHIVAHLSSTFNGAYTFGGGVTTTGAAITGVQQYINALNGQPNGSPTTYSNVTGSPDITINQTRNALYIQDDWKLAEHLTVSGGLRWWAQMEPTILAAVQPRLSVAWSPDKKATWSLHAHAGMFAGRFNAHWWQTLEFANGTDRSINTVYAPTCPGKFDPTACQPTTTGTVIHTVRALQPSIPESYWSAENVGFTKQLPKGFSLSADYYIGQLWHQTRSENINSPLNGSPTGPRPFGANLNILQENASGRGWANVQFVGLTNQSLKRVQFFAGAVRVAVVDDTNDDPFFTPQTTGSNRGEYARRTNQGLWQIFGNASLNLPAKFVWSANWNGSGLGTYNVTTGFDNNGDGNFNDRPQFAPAGTPLCSANPNASPCGYSTPWGELVNSGGTGSLSRDKGILPWTFYLDTNLQRTIRLTADPKADHPKTLSFNIRSSNVLNKKNVTSVGTVLGTPNFGQAVSADNGRRIELGARYSF